MKNANFKFSLIDLLFFFKLHTLQNILFKTRDVISAILFMCAMSQIKHIINKYFYSCHLLFFAIL